MTILGLVKHLCFTSTLGGYGISSRAGGLPPYLPKISKTKKTLEGSLYDFDLVRTEGLDKLGELRHTIGDVIVFVFALAGIAA